MLAPGRLRLATRPVLTGSAAPTKMIGILVVAGLRRFRRISAAAGEDHSDLTIDQITRQLWQPVIMAFRPTVFDRHVLAFHIAGFLDHRETHQQLQNSSGMHC